MIRRFWIGQPIEIDCAMDIEQTGRSFHAHAIPIGVDLRPGDVVTLHGAPSSVDFGQCLSGTCRATIQRANILTRFWTRFTSVFALTHLYEVGFDAKEAI